MDTDAPSAPDVSDEELGFAVDDDDSEVVDAGAGFEVAAADGLVVVDDDDDDDDFALEEDAEVITQFPLWHEKPFGQQLLPHCCNVPDRSVLCSSL